MKEIITNQGNESLHMKKQIDDKVMEKDNKNSDNLKIKPTFFNILKKDDKENNV